MPLDNQTERTANPSMDLFATGENPGHLVGFVTIVTDGFSSMPFLEGKGKPVTGFRGIR